MEIDEEELIPEVEASSSVNDDDEGEASPSGNPLQVPPFIPATPEESVKSARSVDLSGDSIREIHPMAKTLASPSVKEFPFKA